jgi:curved DNA-binding protein CbpA
MTHDYYQVLQLSPDATVDEVHKAYRSLAMRFHPDRNSTPEAAQTMAIINEAYSVIGDPSRRLVYDRQRGKDPAKALAEPILRAAYETLLRQGWIVAKNEISTLILEQGLRAVRVTLVETLGNAHLRKIERQFPGFSVVLAVTIENPVNLSFNTAIIDLMRRKQYGAPFPDDGYRKLFSTFL